MPPVEAVKHRAKAYRLIAAGQYVFKIANLKLGLHLDFDRQKLVSRTPSDLVGIRSAHHSRICACAIFIVSSPSRHAGFCQCDARRGQSASSDLDIASDRVAVVVIASYDDGEPEVTPVRWGFPNQVRTEIRSPESWHCQMLTGRLLDVRVREGSTQCL